MGSGGPGNIVHIENLYVKPQAVKSNTNIVLGDFVIFDTDGLRSLLDGDFGGNNTFLDLQGTPVFQAAENANNLDTTDPLIKKDTISVITTGSDWTCKMGAGVEPGEPVGIKRVDAATPHFQILETIVAKEILGSYKHKEFATLAAISVLNDDGVISTSRG